MTGDCHVRFCERLRGETPLCLLGVKPVLRFLFPQMHAEYSAEFRRRVAIHSAACPMLNPQETEEQWNRITEKPIKEKRGQTYSVRPFFGSSV